MKSKYQKMLKRKLRKALNNTMDFHVIRILENTSNLHAIIMLVNFGAKFICS